MRHFLPGQPVVYENPSYHSAHGTPTRHSLASIRISLHPSAEARLSTRDGIPPPPVTGNHEETRSTTTRHSTSILSMYHSNTGLVVAPNDLFRVDRSPVPVP